MHAGFLHSHHLGWSAAKGCWVAHCQRTATVLCLCTVRRHVHSGMFVSEKPALRLPSILPQTLLIRAPTLTCPGLHLRPPRPLLPPRSLSRRLLVPLHRFLGDPLPDQSRRGGLGPIPATRRRLRADPRRQPRNCPRRAVGEPAPDNPLNILLTQRRLYNRIGAWNDGYHRNSGEGYQQYQDTGSIRSQSVRSEAR